MGTRAGPAEARTIRVVRPTDAATTSFDAVYASERLMLTRLAYLLVRHQPVAEELAQEAFVHLLRRFDDVENPAGFLRTVLVRLCMRWLHRDGMERDRMVVVAGGVPREVGEPELDETWVAMGRLRPERRAVLVLRFYEDLSHGEVAALLGCPAATVRSRTRRALADLRRELAQGTARGPGEEEGDHAGDR